MRLRSIGARLAAWYAAVMALSLLGFAGGIWFALEHSLYHAVDESLRDRVEGVRQFIEAHADWLALEEIRQEFREHSVLGPGGDLFQVSDDDGEWLYRSAPLYDEHVPVYGIDDLMDGPRFENVWVQSTRLRFLSQTVQAADRTYSVQVAAPLTELERGLEEFLWMSLPAVPLLLLVASVGGYWLSRRALRPVDEINTMARHITADDLSRRLTVPDTGDELERLSRTLNGMMERLETAFKRVSRFTADASHELRTPLAVMRTTAEVALRSAQNSDRDEALKEIVVELECTAQLVENMLLMAKADSGEAQLTHRPLDLAETIGEAVSQGRVLAQAKDIRVDLQLSGDRVMVSGDPNALRRLFLQLLDNAVKYTPANGYVEVALHEGEGCAIATVRDTGIGIAEQDLSQIFERFYRADESRSTEHGGGAGLGLSIARWIAEAHGGTLSVESALGNGAKFTFQIPTLEKSSEAEATC